MTSAPPSNAADGSGVVLAIDDAADPRLVPYRDLTDVSLRTQWEQPAGVFIAEGELVINRAVAAGYEVLSLLMSGRWVNPMAQVRAACASAPTYVLPDALIEKLTGFHVHRGALAVIRRPPERQWRELCVHAKRVLIAENVNSHTNMGAMLRNAAGFGFEAVLLSPRCADPLYRRSVRVSMGTVFSVPWARLSHWPAELRELRSAGFDIWALTPDDAAHSIRQLDPPRRLAVLMGAEAEGLSSAALELATHRVQIAMHAGVDSLNVAAATAVAGFAVSRDPTPLTDPLRDQQVDTSKTITLRSSDTTCCSIAAEGESR